MNSLQEQAGLPIYERQTYQHIAMLRPGLATARSFASQFLESMRLARGSSDDSQFSIGPDGMTLERVIDDLVTSQLAYDATRAAVQGTFDETLMSRAEEEKDAARVRLELFAKMERFSEEFKIGHISDAVAAFLYARVVYRVGSEVLTLFPVADIIAEIMEFGLDQNNPIIRRMEEVANMQEEPDGEFNLAPLSLSLSID